VPQPARYHGTCRPTSLIQYRRCRPHPRIEIARYILDVNELAGVTVVLREHDMSVVMDISHRVTALDFGRVIASGSPTEVSVEPAVVKAYLGVPA
jgi:branched-chain amino acid transport system ATP-binding protein